jgi:hypothetical protein
MNFSTIRERLDVAQIWMRGIIKKIQEQDVITTEENGKRRNNKPHKPEPEEHEGVPEHQHCPPAKHREDISPKYHEEQHKDVA